ncbi:MAG: hypothetical protein ACFB9M_00825 [Myxococcota bacterium]
MKKLYFKAAGTLLTAGLTSSLGVGCLSDPDIPSCVDFQLGEAGEECGSPCNVYCQEMVARCPGTFESFAVCFDQCEVEEVDPNIRVGMLGDTTGNSLSCRISQLEADEPSCPDAALLGTTTCIDSACEEYCTAFLDENSPCTPGYDDENDCLNTCALIPVGEDDSDANTVLCRQKFLQMAIDNDDASFCPAASRSGGGVCGGYCETYCGFLQTNCTDENAIYGSLDECLSVCSFMNLEGNIDDRLTPNNIECRIYHGSSPSAATPEFHCRHTRVYNSEFCTGGGTNEDSEVWICRPFCDAVLANCPETVVGPAQCLASCAVDPDVQSAVAAASMDRTTTIDLFPQSTQVCPTP